MSTMIKEIKNVIGFDLYGANGAKKLRDALQPYADYPEVRDHMRNISRFIPVNKNS